MKILNKKQFRFLFVSSLAVFFLFISFGVALASGSDLTASAPPQTTAIVGVAQLFTSTITNGGTATTGAGFTNLFQTSPVNDGSSGVVDYPVSPAMSALGIGGTAGTSRYITFSALGTMYVRACADKSSAADVYGTIVESNEENNCSVWMNVTVITMPIITAVSVTPSSGTGNSQTFSQLYTDTAGAANITQVWTFLEATSSPDTDGTNSCYTRWRKSSNSLYLLNDAGDGWSVQIPIGTAGILSNSKCALDVGASSISLVGNDLTLNLALDFTGGTFVGAGLQKHWMYANNSGQSSGQTSGWQQLGSWTVPASGLPDLTAAPVTPSSATVGVSLSFTSNISNIGTVTTGAGFNNLFQVATAPGGKGAISVISVNALGALASGANTNVTSSSYTFTSSGIHSVRVCADNDASFVGAITESNEGNNCGPWTNVAVYDVTVPVPVVTISANPTYGVVNSVNPEITWSATNTPTSCSFTGDWTNTNGGVVSGTDISQGILDTIKVYIYTLTCSNATGNSIPRSATVVVGSGVGGPAAINATPLTIYSGDSTTLAWSCSTSTSSLGTNFNTGSATSGSVLVTPVATTDFTVVCSPSASADQVTVIVKKKPVFKEGKKD